MHPMTLNVLGNSSTRIPKKNWRSICCPWMACGCRFCALTRRGARALIELRAVWQQFSEAIGGLLAGAGPRGSRHD
jgi:hypothetical protein